jgi:hypothetical protein
MDVDTPFIQVDEGVCGSYPVRDKHKEDFDTGKVFRERKILDFVHAKICGLVNTPSLTCVVILCFLIFTINVVFFH